MLDTKEQAKGGFGARVAREQTRDDAQYRAQYEDRVAADVAATRRGTIDDGSRTPVPALPLPAVPPPAPRRDVAQAIGRASRWDTLSTGERAAIRDTLHHAHVARNAQAEFLAARTFGERLADRIAAFGGSWTFILLFFGFLLLWTGLNTFVLARSHRAFDAYPYIFLNLMLSTLAALQAPVIMMSQQRQTVRDRVAAATDYEVNCKAELEIRALHDKLDTLREAQWTELVRMQQEQIGLLERLLGASRDAADPAAPIAGRAPRGVGREVSSAPDA